MAQVAKLVEACLNELLWWLFGMGIAAKDDRMESLAAAPTGRPRFAVTRKVSPGEMFESVVKLITGQDGLFGC